jgi:hypothetical protein
LERIVVGEPDAVAWSKPPIRVVAVAEAKTPTSVKDIPARSSELVNLYNPSDHRECGFADSIAQVCGYMVDNHVRCGALTSYQRSWFIYRQSKTEFQISDAVQDISSNPTALRAWAFFLDLANSTDRSPEDWGVLVRRNSNTLPPVCPSDDESKSDQSEEDDEDYEPLSKKVKHEPVIQDQAPRRSHRLANPSSTGPTQSRAP